MPWKSIPAERGSGANGWGSAMGGGGATGGVADG